MHLKIGHLSTLYHTSAIMMARQELLGPLSSAVDWELYGTGPAIVEALERKEIDAGYIGLPPAIIGIARGVGITCVAGGHIEGTVMASRRDVKDASSFDDPLQVLSQFTIVGVPGNGSIHDLILRDALDRTGADVEVVNFKWSDALLESFVHNEIDTVIGTPALAQAVITYGDGKVICPPHLLWPDNPSYGILVRREVLTDKHEMIKDFLLSHKRASEVLRTEREAASQDIASYMAVVDDRFVHATLNISPHYCICLTEEYMDCSMRLAGRLKDLGYIGRDVEREEIFDLSLVKELHPELCHYRI